MSVAYLTVATKAYLPWVRVLAGRLRDCGAQGEFYLFLADHPEGFVEPDAEPFHVVTCKDFVAAKRLQRMSFYYNAFELCCALRGDAHLFMLKSTSHDTWVYLDADIAPVEDPAVLLQNVAGSIVLTPHMLAPAGDDFDPAENNLLRYGVFNSGFLAVRRCEASAMFIDWFYKRMERGAFSQYRGCFSDQLWMNVVPYFFPEVAVTRHIGANIGYWNIDERAFELRGGRFVSPENMSLLFCHFSGWDPLEPHQISRFYWKAGPAPAFWASVADEYSRQLREAGWAECKDWPYSFATFRNGVPIKEAYRRAYFEQWRQGLWEENDPFECPEYLIPEREWSAVPRLRRRLGALGRRLAASVAQAGRAG